MPCRRKSSVRRASKPAVFTASFQPLGATDLKLRSNAEKELKGCTFITVSKTCVAPRGYIHLLFGCLVETLLIASFASRIGDELNFLENDPLGSSLQA